MLPQKKILIYRIGSLGDTIIALPVFHKVREMYPDADITLLCNQPIMSKAAPLEAVLGNEYFFNRVINYPIGTRNPFVLLRLIKTIRALKIEVGINLSTTRVLKTIEETKQAVSRDKWFFRAGGIKQYIGAPQLKEDFELNVDVNSGEIEWEAKRLARRIEVLGPIDLKADRYWDLKFNEAEIAAANSALSSFNSENRIVAISVGTKRQSNDWEDDNWLQLISRLKTLLPGWKLLVVGAADETARAEKFISIWGHAEAINLCGKTSPRVSGAILKNAQVFIGHDSGPMHLAACVGTPCVGIFSARNFPRQWYPRGDYNKIIYHKTDCAGCLLEVCIEQQKKCILSITVSEVIDAVKDVLKAHRQIEVLST